MFLCPPGEPPRPDGVSDGTLITQPSKRAVLGRSDWKGDGCVVVREVAFGGKQSRAGRGGGNTGEQSGCSTHGAIRGFLTIFSPSFLASLNDLKDRNTHLIATCFK